MRGSILTYTDRRLALGWALFLHGFGSTPVIGLDRIDLKEAAEPSGLFSAARRRSIRSRHELGLTQSCEVRRLIVQIQRKNKAKTKRFILAYRLINFATPSVAFDLHVNLKYNYSKWRRFCTSRPPVQKSRFISPGKPRDRYPIIPMGTTTVKFGVAFS